MADGWARVEAWTVIGGAQSKDEGPAGGGQERALEIGIEARASQRKAFSAQPKWRSVSEWRVHG